MTVESRAAAKKPKSSLEKAKVAIRFGLIIGWSLAVSGVGIFTYAEAYPKVGKQPHQVGSLTLSQFGFWLIISGVGLVVVSVLSSQGLSCLMKQAKEDYQRNAIHASLGTSHDDGGIEEEEHVTPLIGPSRVDYGSTVRSQSSPFSSKIRSASVITSANSPFSKHTIISN